MQPVKDSVSARGAFVARILPPKRITGQARTGISRPFPAPQPGSHRFRGKKGYMYVGLVTLEEIVSAPFGCLPRLRSRVTDVPSSPSETKRTRLQTLTFFCNGPSLHMLKCTLSPFETFTLGKGCLGSNASIIPLEQGHLQTIDLVHTQMLTLVYSLIHCGSTAPAVRNRGRAPAGSHVHWKDPEIISVHLRYLGSLWVRIFAAEKKCIRSTSLRLDFPPCSRRTLGPDNPPETIQPNITCPDI